MQVISRCRFDKSMLREILERRDKILTKTLLSIYPDDYRCEREAHHDGLCIFHSTKKPDNFQDKLNEEIERMLIDDDIKESDFTDCIFPSINLSGKKFNKSIKFFRASFQSAYFIRAEFKASAIYLDIVNQGIIDFSFSIFEEHLYMKPKENGYLIFHMKTFKKPSQIKMSNLSLEKVSFLNTELNGVALVPNKNSKVILDDILLEYEKESDNRDEKPDNMQESEDLYKI